MALFFSGLHERLTVKCLIPNECCFNLCISIKSNTLEHMPHKSECRRFFHWHGFHLVGPYQHTPNSCLKISENSYECSPYWSILRHFCTWASWTSYVINLKRNELEKTFWSQCLNLCGWWATFQSWTDWPWKSVPLQCSKYWKYHRSMTQHLYRTIFSWVCYTTPSARHTGDFFCYALQLLTNTELFKFSYIRSISSLPQHTLSVPKSHFFLCENCI